MASHLVKDYNRLSLCNKHLASEWDYDKNDGTPDNFAINSIKIVWWKCKKCSFEWEARIVDRNRYRPTGKNGRTRIIKKGCAQCPKCHSIYTKCPSLLDEWDYNKNLLSPFVMSSSKEKVHWKCKKCLFLWESSLGNRIKGSGKCPQCNSILLKFPSMAAEYSKENKRPVYLMSYGSTQKVKWECKLCHNKWLATVGSRTSGGNGCPKCSKLILKDGTICDSKTEAYYYLLLRKNSVNFLYNGEYGLAMGRRRYDFYLPDENKYIEVTAFHKNSRNVNYKEYMDNIKVKRQYVEKVLRAKFELVIIKLTKNMEKILAEHLL